MDLIKELHFVLSQQYSGELEKVIPADSKLRKLFDLIVNHQVDNDDEAAMQLYKIHKVDKKYLMLKRSLVHKLTDLVFKLPNTDNLINNYESIRFIVSKELLIAEKLLNENVYHNPTKIIVKVEQLASQYFLTDLQLEAAIKLRSVYALKGYPTETEVYHNKVKHLQVLHQQLIDAQGFWDLIYSKTKFSIAKTDDLFKETTTYQNQIDNWLSSSFNPFLKLYSIRIGLVANYQKNRFGVISHLLIEYQDLIVQYPFLVNKHLTLDLFYQKALYYRHSKKLDFAIKKIEDCLQISQYQAFNRFLVQELHFDVLVKLEDYDKALAVLNEVSLQPQFSFLDPYDKSVWAIREAYLYFIFFATDKLHNIQKLPNFSNGFDLNGFLDRTKKSAKDKYGYNIVLLLIRMQLLLIKDQKRAEYEGNNLMIYFHRYMKNHPDQRTIEFLKTISKLASQNFLSDTMQNVEQTFLARINSLDDHYDTTEIIPYKKFWELTKRLIP